MPLPLHPSHHPHPLSNSLDDIRMSSTDYLHPKQPIHVATSPKKLSPSRDIVDEKILEFDEENEVSHHTVKMAKSARVDWSMVLNLCVQCIKYYTHCI